MPAQRVTYGRLSPDARRMIKGMTAYDGGTIAGYIRHHMGDSTWHGDRCGCIDDRCAGHHHGAQEPCGCLEPCIDMYLEQLMERMDARGETDRG